VTAVDLIDLDILGSYCGQCEVDTAAEPATAALPALGGLAVMCYRRKCLVRAAGARNQREHVL